MEEQTISATSAPSARSLIAKLEEMRDGGYSPDWMHIIATVSNYLTAAAALPGIDLAKERALFIARQRQKDSIPDFIDDDTIMKGEITQHEWAGWQDRAAIAASIAGAAAPAENRRIPDSECAQGSCMRMSTGCLGKCALAKHNLPITTTAVSIP